MQELVIDRIEEKTPRAGGNPFFVVYGQGGEEMTTFDTKIRDLGKGARINVEPKIDGKHINIARWELIEAAAPGGPSGAYKRDTEGIRYEYQLKAHLQAIERASIEAQTAFNGIIELVKAAKLVIDDPKAVEALEWALAKIVATRQAIQPGAPVEPAPGKPTGEPEAPFPHIGALLDWCSKQDPPVSRADFLNIVGAKEEDLGKVDIPTAYQMVKDHLAAKRSQVQ